MGLVASVSSQVGNAFLSCFYMLSGN